MLIVQICDFGNDGDAQYRLHDPSVFLSRLEGVTVVDCHFAHRHVRDLAQCADVLVVQFVDDWDLLSVCARRRAAGRVTVFEANDYFFDMQPWSPIASKWQDRNVQELYLQWLAEADGVQTSTEELSRRWRQRGARQTAVFENQLIDVPELPPAPSRPLTIGWGGSPGHFADWYQASPHLARWLDEHPEVHLAVMTHDLARPFFNLPAERYHFTSFGSLSDYLRFLRSVDVGIVPLLPTDYNRCRSDVKFLEYASQGVVGIYADLEPYRGKVVHGQTGLLFQNPAELIDRLELLRRDPLLRQELRLRAHDYVRRQRRLTDHIDKRRAWYRDLLPNRWLGAELPGEIAGAAVSDGRYLQLRPQEPESAYLKARALPKQNLGESISMLTAVVDRQPQYVMALQTLGQTLNSQRDHRQAMQVLNRALNLEPRSPRTLCEIGRTWYLLNDSARAKSVLKETVEIDPRHLPAWQYLLRLLALNRSPEGPEWAERAETLFPSCYPLALLGVQTYSADRFAIVLRDLLMRTAPTLTAQERPVALAAFRPAILSAAQATPFGDEIVSLLRCASDVFPESARFANDLAAALERSGRASEAHFHYARALQLSRQAKTYQEEFPQADAPSWTWQFADFIWGLLGKDCADR
jgi:tetratricopeptide (TPR) repeat protein